MQRSFFLGGYNFFVIFFHLGDVFCCNDAPVSIFSCGERVRVVICTHYTNARSLTTLFSQFGNGVSSFVLHCDAWHVLLAVVATVICVFVLT